MESTEIQTFQPNSVCKICNSKLPGRQQAESHYASARHKNNVRLYKKKIAKPASSLRIYQPVDSKATMNDFRIPRVFEKPINSSKWYHQMFYCDLCNLKLLTKQEQVRHVKEFPHCTLAEMKTSLLKKGIDKQFYSLNKTKKSIHCILCKINMFSYRDCQSHLNGVGHSKKFDIWCSDQQIKVASKPAVNLLNSKNYNMHLNSTSNVKQYYTGVEHQRLKPISVAPLNENLTCYICKTSIVKSKKDKHIKKFPHADLLTVKNQLIKMGIKTTFCTYSKEIKTLKCILCNVIMHCSPTVKSHFQGKLHVKKFNSWSAKQPVENLSSQATNKWYYCDICNFDLDGTADAARHYEEKSHLKRVAQTAVEQPTKTKDNNDHLKLEDFVANLTQSNTHKADKDIQTDLNLEDITKVKLSKLSLKTYIFHEIEKLVQTLYFSKKMPYEVSLQYLKTINKNIEDIVKKYHQKKKINSCCDISCDKSVSSEVNNSTVEDEFLLIDSKEPNMRIANNNETILLDEKQPDRINHTSKTIPEILRFVEIKKSLIERNTCYLEVEISIEVEQLLIQIEDPKASFIEILKYLKTFNKVLDDPSVLEREMILG